MAIRSAIPSIDPAPPGARSRLNQLSDLETELAALGAMSLADLRKRWQSVTDKPVPRVAVSTIHWIVRECIGIDVFPLGKRTAAFYPSHL